MDEKAGNATDAVQSLYEYGHDPYQGWPQVLVEATTITNDDYACSGEGLAQLVFCYAEPSSPGWVLLHLTEDFESSLRWVYKPEGGKVEVRVDAIRSIYKLRKK